MERGGGVLGAGGGEQQAVHGLDQVVAALVERVDGVLDPGDGGVAGGGVAGLVFLVPEIEVGAVVGEGELEQEIGLAGVVVRRGRGESDARGVAGRGLVPVPAQRGLVVQAGDLKSVQHWRVRRRHGAGPYKCIRMSDGPAMLSGSEQGHRT